MGSWHTKQQGDYNWSQSHIFKSKITQHFWRLYHFRSLENLIYSNKKVQLTEKSE
jgi:hypothetical protein